MNTIIDPSKAAKIKTYVGQEIQLIASPYTG
jgi:hypothetical protein